MLLISEPNTGRGAETCKIEVKGLIANKARTDRKRELRCIQMCQITNIRRGLATKGRD